LRRNDCISGPNSLKKAAHLFFGQVIMASSRSKRRNGGGRVTDSTNVASPQPPVVEPQRPTPPASHQGSLELDRIGDILKRVRERRTEALEDIAEYLRIRPTYLSALEDSRYEDLPADAYVIGFLRTYANYLGLDGRAAIDQYRKEMAGRRRKPHLTMPQPLSEGQTPTAPVIVGALVAALVIYILWFSLSGSDKRETPPPSIPQAEQQVTPPSPEPVVQPVTNGALPTVGASGIPTPLPTEAAPQPAPEPQASAESAAPVEPQAPTLVITANKESWLLITDAKGSTVYDHVLKPEESYTLPNQQGLKLTTGNAAGLNLTLNGTPVEVFEKNAHVVRNMPIDLEKLKK
jgi:cytoskeletal protein RodZ